ncbi:MAG: VOC family protein [Opitutaceae bacterium]
MKIEHFAFQVDSPAEVADWYCAQFGFTVKRALDGDAPVRFLADSSGQVMIEIYNNPAVKTPTYREMHPLLLHLAFVCDQVEGKTAALIQAGAELFSGPDTLANGDQLAMLRDPWGFSIQLCARGDAMV